MYATVKQVNENARRQAGCLSPRLGAILTDCECLWCKGSIKECVQGAHYRLLKFPEVEALCCLDSATNHVICNVFQDLTGWMRWKYLDSTFSLLYMLHRTTLSVFNAT